MVSNVRTMLPLSARKVRRNASTELSRRFRRFVVISACRLRSRSAGRSLLRPLSTWVSYNSSYFRRRVKYDVVTDYAKLMDIVGGAA